MDIHRSLCEILADKGIEPDKNFKELFDVSINEFIESCDFYTMILEEEGNVTEAEEIKEKAEKVKEQFLGKWKDKAKGWVC